MTTESVGNVEVLTASRLTLRWLAAGVMSLLVAAILGLTVGPANIDAIDALQEFERKSLVPAKGSLHSKSGAKSARRVRTSRYQR